MRITATYDELKAAARERQAKQLASLPEPVVVNIEALIAFNAPRPFVWGGVGYRAPPLSYADGVRCLVAANALRDLREAEAHRLTAAVSAAALLVPPLVQPASRWRRARAKAFRRHGAEALEGLLRWLTSVLDDVLPALPVGPPITFDFMDAFAGFCREFPAWCNRDGVPRSWAHYVYGTRHLARVRAREDVRLADAMRAAGADLKDYRGWHKELRQLAGWN